MIVLEPGRGIDSMLPTPDLFLYLILPVLFGFFTSFPTCFAFRFSFRFVVWSWFVGHFQRFP